MVRQFRQLRFKQLSWLFVFPVFYLGALAIAAPYHVHLTWQRAPDSTVTVTWRSTADYGVVEYGQDWNFGQSVTAQTMPYGGNYLHIAEITGLKPGTRYYYRAGKPYDWSGGYTFLTAPRPGTPFHFTVWGDTQHYPEKIVTIRNQMQKLNPDFCITKGDNVEDGGNQELWDNYFNIMQDLIAYKPIMPVVGNHDRNAANYYNQFALPVHMPSAWGYPDEGFYSYDYGNTHFVVFSTEPTDGVGGNQYKWMEWDLAQASSRPDIQWIVVYGHQPPYNSGNHGPNMAVQKNYVPLFEKYGVDITFWGHAHSYERTKPLRQGQVVGQGGITYIVAGSSASNLKSVGSSYFTAYSKSLFHFLNVNVSASEFRVEARDENGNVFDSVVLNKKPQMPKTRWVLDGQLDNAAKLISRGTGLSLKSLYAGFDGQYLYVATEGANTNYDHYILVSNTRPDAQIGAPWGKAGSVWNYHSVLAMESNGRWSGWQYPNTADENMGFAANPGGGMMEGILDLTGKYGSTPSSIYLAAVAYGTNSGDNLSGGQVPPGNGNGDLEIGEWYELKLGSTTSQWNLDGVVDEAAQLVASGSGEGAGLKSLYAGFDGRYFYVAADRVSDKCDQFILFSSTRPTQQVVAPWGKAGQVWFYHSVLSMEADHGWLGWQTDAGSTDGTGQAASPAGSQMMEGVIDLYAKYGAIPDSIYLATGRYGTNSGEGMCQPNGQLPMTIDGDGDLAIGEWYEFKLNNNFIGSNEKGDSIRDLSNDSDASGGACSLSNCGWKASYLAGLLPLMIFGLFVLGIRRSRRG